MDGILADKHALLRSHRAGAVRCGELTRAPRARADACVRARGDQRGRHAERLAAAIAAAKESTAGNKQRQD
jgi:hypothetical protein